MFDTLKSQVRRIQNWPGTTPVPSLPPSDRPHLQPTKEACDQCRGTAVAPSATLEPGAAPRPQLLNLLCADACTYLHAQGVIIHGGGGDEAVLLQQNVPLRSGYRLRRDRRLYLRVATHAGKTNPDKSNNEDFVLGWLPRSGQKNATVKLAVAVADGVSSCLYPEWAAEAACWRALCELVRNAPAPQASDVMPKDQAESLAVRSMDAVLADLRVIRESLTTSASMYKPVGEFDSTWNYRLRQGKILQTTLMLAWVDLTDTLHIASVGDGGALLRSTGKQYANVEEAGELIMNCDPTTNDVRALGPNSPAFSDLAPEQRRAWLHIASRDFRLPGRCLLFTDGVGRCFAQNPLELFSFIEKRRKGQSEKSLPLRCLRDLAAPANWPQRVEPDNLTLAIIYRAS